MGLPMVAYYGTRPLLSGYGISLDFIVVFISCSFTQDGCRLKIMNTENGGKRIILLNRSVTVIRGHKLSCVEKCGKVRWCLISTR